MQANGTSDDCPLVKWGLPGTVAKDVKPYTSIHVYDFDNTLFITPGPNHALFTNKAIDILFNSQGIKGGGWWSDVRIFKATGTGWTLEKEKAWEGWWNEDVVALVRDSMADPSVLTILLTGRRPHFGPLIQTMLSAKGLTFDAVVTRNSFFKNTLDFKIQFLTELLEHFANVNRIDVFEDRAWHARSFKTFLSEYKEAMRHNLDYNVTLVSGEVRFLDPAVENSLISRIVKEHNAAYNSPSSSHPQKHRLVLSEIHLFTGYILKSESRARLLAAYMKLIPSVDNLKVHANAIIIKRMTVSKKDASSLKYGKHYQWRATEFGNYNNDQWAIKMEPIGFRSKAEQPMVILAQRKKPPVGGSIFSSPDTVWTPLEEPIEVETQLGDWSVKKITKKV